MLRTFLLIAMLTLPAVGAAGTRDGCVQHDEVARWIGGDPFGEGCYDIARKDEVVYLPRPESLRLVDVSDPVRPFAIGDLPLAGDVRQLRIAGDVLACVTGAGTVLFDISDPARPLLLWEHPSAARGVAFAPERFFLLTDAALEAYALVAGQVPQLESSLEVPVSRLLEYDSGLLFTYENSGSIRCYDVTVPGAVVARGAHQLFNVKDLVARDRHVFATYVSNISGGRLGAIDATDPDSLVPVSSTQLYCGWLADMELDGDCVIVTSGNDLINAGFVVVNISAPAHPEWLGRCDAPYAPHALAISRPGEVTVGMNRGFAIFDASSRQFVHESAYAWPPAPLWGAVALGDRVLTATTEGLAVWNVAQPLHPTVLVQPLWDEDLRAMHQDGLVLLVGSQDGEVYEVDVANPSSPVRTASYTGDKPIQAIATSADWIATARGTSGLALFERHAGWSQPPTTQLSGVADWGNVVSDVRDVAFSGTNLIVGDWNYGVVVFAVSDDGTLSPRDMDRQLQPIATIATRGNIVYAAGGSGMWSGTRRMQLHTLRVEADGNLTRLDTQQIPSGASQLKIVGDLLYVGMPEMGVFVYALDEEIPSLLGGVATLAPFGGWDIHDFCVGPDYIFAAAEAGGLRVLPAQCAAPVADDLVAAIPAAHDGVCLAAQPNPFNPSTTVSFALEAPGPARLEVYDLAGARVRTLVDEVLPQGGHDIVWDGRDDGGRQLASGTYVARLVAQDRRAVRKIVLVK